MKLLCIVFPKQNYNILPPNFHIHAPVRDLYIPSIGLPILLQPKRQINPGNIYMNVGIRNEAAQFHLHKSDFWYSVQSLQPSPSNLIKRKNFAELDFNATNSKVSYRGMMRFKI